MQTFVKKRYIVFIFLLLLSGKNTAQKEEQPFSRFTISFDLSKPEGYKNLSGLWKSNTGFSAYIRTPIYFGDAEFGVQHLPLNGVKDKYPEMKTYFFSIGWAGKLSLPLNIDFLAGIKAGSVLMTFKVDTASTFQKNESELGVCASAKINWEIFKGIGIEGGIDFITIYTHRKMKYYVVSGGISYAFDSPLWLREFFE